MLIAKGSLVIEFSAVRCNRATIIIVCIISIHNIAYEQTGKNRATKENIIRVAEEAEDTGFDSLWVLERLIWPINPQKPYPETVDGKFPEDWQYILDPLETLTFVAANTDKIALGTSIIDILFHNPVILARRFATLARIANHANGWICVVRNSLEEVKSNIDRIIHECHKVNRDAKDIQIAAILYPNVIESAYEDRQGEQQQRHFLSGSIDQVGRDFQEVKKIGIGHAILNYNRSVISDNISKIIEVSKELSRFVR
jgi:alkanesulfonate monooxygenase SsuD/methylene tetrahydromethanopterin reductase-like flavin-dependent oxidoreductase (luciferase family)